MTQSSKTRIVVLGSLNMDVVLNLSAMPERGETVHAQALSYIPGGKGGNQAVACARHGAQVALIGAVGQDAHADVLRSALAADGIDVRYITAHDAVSTGSAVVMVEADGSNRIAVIPGANALADTPANLLEILRNTDFLVLQFETPLDVLQRAITCAHQAGCKVVLNPSPVQTIPAAWWPMIDTLVVNEHEAAELSGLAVTDAATALQAAQCFAQKGVPRVVITLGSQGAVALDACGHSVHPAPKVRVIDTTSAGDTFLGTMTTRLGEGCTLGEAVQWGIRAASLCIARAGAQPSIPQRAEVQSL